MSDVNERVEVVRNEKGQCGFRVPPKLLEKFLDVIRDMGVEFTVESDPSGSKIVRLNSEADHARVAAAIESSTKDTWDLIRPDARYLLPAPETARCLQFNSGLLLSRSQCAQSVPRISRNSLRSVGLVTYEFAPSL